MRRAEKRTWGVKNAQKGSQVVEETQTGWKEHKREVKNGTSTKKRARKREKYNWRKESGVERSAKEELSPHGI